MKYKPTVMKKLSKNKNKREKGEVIFILSSVPSVIIRKITVVLKLPNKVDSFLIRVAAIIQAMTDNVWFPDAANLLADVRDKNEKLRKKQNSAKTRAKGTAKARDAQKNKVKDAMDDLKDYVQKICRSNPENALAIVESALMYAKGYTHGQKFKFKAKKIPSGVIKLLGTVAEARCHHDWGWSLNKNDPNSWLISPVDSTKKARTFLRDLPIDQKIYFRHRCLTSKGYTNWEYISLYND